MFDPGGLAGGYAALGGALVILLVFGTILITLLQSIILSVFFARSNFVHLTKEEPLPKKILKILKFVFLNIPISFFISTLLVISIVLLGWNFPLISENQAHSTLFLAFLVMILLSIYILYKIFKTEDILHSLLTITGIFLALFIINSIVFGLLIFIGEITNAGGPLILYILFLILANIAIFIYWAYSKFLKKDIN